MTIRGQMATKRRGRPRIDGDVEFEIKRLAHRGWTPAQIHRELERRPKFRGRVPVNRTVQRAVARLKPPPDEGDEGEEWSLADADPAEAALVLPALAEVLEFLAGDITGAPRPYFPKKQAAWIAHLRTAAPDMPGLWAFFMAMDYWVFSLAGEPMDALDELVAFAPWRDDAHYRRYFRSVQAVHPNWFEYIDFSDDTIRLAPGVPRRAETALNLATMLREMQKEMEARHDETRQL